MYVARDANWIYRLMQRCLWALFRAGTHLRVSGFEHVPTTGGLIVCPNHIHSLDIPLVGMAIPRRCTVMAADKWKGTPGGWIIERVTHIVYVARGEPDRAALAECLRILRAGESLAVAPEGTRSRQPGLQEGHDGAAYLATRSGSQIVPVAVWGQEQVFDALRQLRRAEVHLRIGPPIILAPDAARARSAELHGYTEQIMAAIAAMLPAEYRGVYEGRTPPGTPQDHSA